MVGAHLGSGGRPHGSRESGAYAVSDSAVATGGDVTSTSPTPDGPNHPRRPYLAPLTAGMLLALGIVLVWWHAGYRSMEIRLSGLLIDLVTSSGVHVVPQRQTVYFGLGTDHALGLRISPECTSAFLVVPLLVAAAAMVWLRPRITARVLGSLGVGALVLVLVNQLRMLTLVGLISNVGRDRGYYLGHTLFGSMVSVFGGAVALVLFVWLSTRAPRRGNVVTR
jgi:exosortase/archaeosortase family protein